MKIYDKRLEDSEKPHWAGRVAMCGNILGIESISDDCIWLRLDTGYLILTDKSELSRLLYLFKEANNG